MEIISGRSVSVFINGGDSVLEIQIGVHVFQFWNTNGFFNHFVEPTMER